MKPCFIDINEEKIPFTKTYTKYTIRADIETPKRLNFKFRCRNTLSNMHTKFRLQASISQ